jgi:hypothetical protein
MRMAWMLAGVLMATGAQAQEAQEPVRRNVVALDVGGLLQNTVGVAAERAVLERMTVRLGLRAGLNALWTRNPLGVASTDGAVVHLSSRDTSLALEPGARFFLTGRALEGLWVGPQLGLKLGWVRTSWSTESGGLQAGSGAGTRSLSVSGSALAGYSAIVGKGVALQAAAGLALSHSSALGESYGLGYPNNGSSQWALQPVTQLSLGYAF